MAWNGAGLFSRVHNWVTDKANSVDITASRMDAEDDGFATGLNNCLTKNGENTPTADLPMGGFNHSGVDDGTARDHYASIAQTQDGAVLYAADSGAADAYVMALSPAITAYATGQTFLMKAANANTGASTVNINSVGSKAIVDSKNTALASGDIASGQYYSLMYDGTSFRITSSSLDADTLDGLDSTDFVKIATAGTITADHTISGASPSFKFKETDQGADLKDWNIVAFDGKVQVQTRTEAGAFIINTLLIDRSGNGTFAGTLSAEGSLVWHAGNDGAGSGLDADTLDTINSTQFIRSDEFDIQNGGMRIDREPGASVVYDDGHLELRSDDAGVSDVSIGFHRAGGFSGCQLRHESSGLILSGTTRTNAANFYAYGTIESASTVIGSNLSGTNTGDEVAATESTAGVVEQLTQAEVDAGTDTSRYPTIAKLLSGYSSSFSANGYFKLPGWLGGLTLQWGSVTSSGTSANNAAATLPLTFATGGLAGFASIGGSGSLNNFTVQIGTVSTTTLNMTTLTDGVISTSINAKWYAIGY